MKKMKEKMWFGKRILTIITCVVVCLAMMPVSVNAKVVGVNRVTGLKATASTTNSITINWNAVQGSTGYEIYRATSRDGAYKLLYTMTSGNHTFKNTTVEPGTAYYYRVRAFVQNGKDRNYGKYSQQLASFTKLTSKKRVKSLVNVNLRRHAGTNYNRVITIPKGKKLKMFYTTRDKNNVKWSRVDYKVKGKTYRGFIRSDLAK